MEELSRPTRNEDVAAIVDTIRKRRMALGLSQWDVAVLTGTSQSRISEIETGTTGNPQSDSLALVARALGLRLIVADERMFLEEVPFVGTVDEGL